jgi:hypothetical protein
LILIKDNNGKIILAYVGPILFYNTSEQEDEEFDIEDWSSIPFEHLDINNNGGLKLFTLLEYQKELGVLTDIDEVVHSIKLNIPYLSTLIDDYNSTIVELENRIILLEEEGSGPATSWTDRLYLNDDGFKIQSSRKGNESASEIIDYYGLGNNEYWDQIQANGEFIEQSIFNIKSGEDLYKGIIELLTNEEQWNIKEEDINWQLIINNLVAKSAMEKIGLELKKICSS